MFDRLRNLLAGEAAAPPKPDEPLSAALLLMELARADLEVAEVELIKIRDVLAARYHLDDPALDRLLDEARTQGAQAVSLYDYVQAINARLDPAGKSDLMEMLWQVAYADGHLDKYEESLLRKVAGMLYVTDAEFIRTKLSVTGQ